MLCAELIRVCFRHCPQCPLLCCIHLSQCSVPPFKEQTLLSRSSCGFSAAPAEGTGSPTRPVPARTRSLPPLNIHQQRGAFVPANDPPSTSPHSEPIVYRGHHSWGVASMSLDKHTRTCIYHARTIQNIFSALTSCGPPVRDPSPKPWQTRRILLSP